MIKICNKISKKNIEKLTKPIVFNCKDYKLNSKLSGKNIKMAIIDSGYPTHPILNKASEITSFCENSDTYKDKFGHSSLVSGIISSNSKKSIIGVAPKTKIYYSKAVDDNGNCCFNALLASILWAITKKVNIIVLALGSQIHYPILHDAIKKAFYNNICIISASGNDIKNKEIDYPSRYPEVLSIGAKTRSSIYNKVLKEQSSLVVQKSSMFTTFLDDKYVKASGSSIATAFVAGIASLLIEDSINKSKKYTNLEIYEDLKKIKF